MPDLVQPNELAASPKRYEEPDYTADGNVTKIYLPASDATIGWVVWQDPDRIAWFNVSQPDQLGYIVNRYISQLLRDCARDDVPAATAFGRILQESIHDDGRMMPLDEFIRTYWTMA